MRRSVQVIWEGAVAARRCRPLPRERPHREQPAAHQDAAEAQPARPRRVEGSCQLRRRNLDAPIVVSHILQCGNECRERRTTSRSSENATRVDPTAPPRESRQSSAQSPSRRGPRQRSERSRNSRRQSRTVPVVQATARRRRRRRIAFHAHRHSSYHRRRLAHRRRLVELRPRQSTTRGAARRPVEPRRAATAAPAPRIPAVALRPGLDGLHHGAPIHHRNGVPDPAVILVLFGPSRGRCTSEERGAVPSGGSMPRRNNATETLGDGPRAFDVPEVIARALERHDTDGLPLSAVRRTALLPTRITATGLGRSAGGLHQGARASRGGVTGGHRNNSPPDKVHTRPRAGTRLGLSTAKCQFPLEP